jgi:ABC-type polysaccharide/polyol phosphate export permease
MDFKVGDFVTHRVDGSIGLVMATKGQIRDYIKTLWLFCGKQTLNFISAYDKKSMQKICKNKTLVKKAKCTLNIVFQNKKIDNLTYMEICARLRKYEQELA